MVFVIDLVTSSSPKSSKRDSLSTPSKTSILTEKDFESNLNSPRYTRNLSPFILRSSTLSQSTSSLPKEDSSDYEKFKREWRNNLNLEDEFTEFTDCNSAGEKEQPIPKRKRRTSETFTIIPVTENSISVADKIEIKLNRKFKNKLEAISSIRLFMSRSMAEAYELELRRRFNERQMAECVAFDIENVIIPAEMASFRWKFASDKYDNDDEFLDQRLFVLNSETLWDEYIAPKKFKDLLEAFNEPNVFLYFMNWKRACQKHTSALNRQFKLALNTSSETIQLTPANELENDFFLTAAQLRLQVNFGGAVSAPQSLVDLMDFVIEMTRVVALKGYLKESRERHGDGSLDLNLTLARDVKVKSGKDERDCWIKILCQIPRVTVPLAESIAARYPSFYSLMEAYDSCSNFKDGETLLSDLRLEDGGGNSRRIGPVISARIYNHFH